MAFAFNTEKMQPKVMDRLELLNAQEELNQAFMDLTDAQKGMTEVCEVMENIQTSVDLITKYGVAGVEQLNIDGSLEALCGVEAKLITAEKAMEGLGEAAKAAWEKFKEIVKTVWLKIKQLFLWLIDLSDRVLNVFHRKLENAKSTILKKKSGTESLNESDAQAEEHAILRSGAVLNIKDAVLHNVNLFESTTDVFGKIYRLVKGTSSTTAVPENKLQEERHYAHEVIDAYRDSNLGANVKFLSKSRFYDNSRRFAVGGTVVDVTYYDGKWSDDRESFIDPELKTWDSDRGLQVIDSVKDIERWISDCRRKLDECKTYDLSSIIPNGINDSSVLDFFRNAQTDLVNLMRLMKLFHAAMMQLSYKVSDEITKVAKRI